MEVVQTFENLSDAEKLKFFEVVKNLNRTESKDLESNNKPSSPLKPTLDGFLENLLGARNITEESSHVGGIQSPEKNKQKTLDSWLIKKSSSSTSKIIKDPKRSLQEPILNVDSGGINVECDPISLCRNAKTTTSINMLPSKMCTSDEELSNSKSEKTNDMCSSFDKSTNSLNASHSQLRSKRKKCLTPSPTKGMIQTIASPEIIGKTTYNLGTKRKVTKKIEDVIGNSYISHCIDDQDVQCDPINQIISEDTLNAASSSSQHNYKAFRKVISNCEAVGLREIDVHHILRHASFQKLLNDYETQAFNNAAVIIGKHESSDKKIQPVVYVHKSNLTDINEILQTLQNRNIP